MSQAYATRHSQSAKVVLGAQGGIDLFIHDDVAARSKQAMRSIERGQLPRPRGPGRQERAVARPDEFFRKYCAMQAISMARGQALAVIQILPSKSTSILLAMRAVQCEPEDGTKASIQAFMRILAHAHTGHKLCQRM